MRQWFSSHCKIFGLIHHPDHSPNISHEEIELHFSLSILLVRYAIDRSIGVVPETSGRWMASTPPQWPALKQGPLDRHPTAKAFLGWTLVSLGPQLTKSSSLHVPDREMNSVCYSLPPVPHSWNHKQDVSTRPCASELTFSSHYPLARCEGTIAQGTSASWPWILRKRSRSRQSRQSCAWHSQIRHFLVEDCNSRPVLGEFQSPVSLHSYHENFFFVSINFR